MAVDAGGYAKRERATRGSGQALILCGESVETDCHAPSEEILVLRPATAAISLSIPPKIQRCTG
jgi:hypothetical protein